MKLVAHISDPHFGTEDPVVVDRLLADLEGAALVVVSGDLTQRAHTHQFLAARAFLDRIPARYLVVPGNHDVPLYDVVSRFVRPLATYRRLITEDLSPSYFDDEVAAVGIASAHGFTFKDGRITDGQVLRVCRQLSKHDVPWKMLVSHHPFVVPSGVPQRDRIDGAEDALPRLEACGVDLILSGHLHVPHASDAAGFRSGDRRIISIHAGTCVSTRLRGEPNGYNQLALDGDDLTITHRVWSGAGFVDGPVKVYRRHHDPAGGAFARLA